MKVVTEATPLEGDYVAVNSMSLTGSVSHVILKKNPKRKVRADIQNNFKDGVPRLFMASARDEFGMNKIFDMVESGPLDEEYFYLANDVFSKDIQGHLFRGYTVLPKTENSQRNSMEVGGGKQRPIWFIFSGMGSQWSAMGRSLLQFPVFAAAMHKCQAALKPKGIDLINILSSDDPAVLENVLNCFVGIAAVQIGLVDLLYAMGIKPDGIVGHSVGELGCAYADGCFTVEETILCAHARGRASLETNLIKGVMAAVGMGYQQIKDELPASIEVACHNSASSCTLSGPAADMEAYIQQLKDRKVFAKLVNVANIAYHSRYIAPAAPTLLNYLKEVIVAPKKRSSKWISSSVPEAEWEGGLAQWSSPEYHTNNLLKPVLFEEASAHIKKDAICIEIAPHGLLQAILKRMSSNGCTNIPLTLRGHKDGARFFLEAVGKMYLNGLLPDVKKLYPSIEFPASRGTQPLCELITWDHSEIWASAASANVINILPGLRNIRVDLNNIKHHFFLDHKINDRWILPEAAHLYFAWETLMLLAKEFSFDKTVIFENIRFHEMAVIDAKTTVLEVNILLQIGSGNWELLINDKITATGCVREAHEVYDNVDDYFLEEDLLEFHETGNDVKLDKKDVYEILGNVGFSLRGGFESIQSVVLNEKGVKSSIVFSDNWTQFLDGIMKIATFGKIEADNKLYMPTAIQKLIVKADKIRDGQVVDIIMDYHTNRISCPALKVFGIQSEQVTVEPLSDINLRLDEYRFVPHFNSSTKGVEQLLTVSMQLALENCISHQNVNYELEIIVLDDKSRINHLIPKIEEAVHGKSNLKIKILPASRPLDELLENKTKPSSLLIITAENSLKNSLDILQKHQECHVLAFVASQNDLIRKSNCKVLYQQQVANDNIVLLKKTIKPETRSWSVIHASNPNWLSELAFLRSSSSYSNSNHVIYLVVDEEQHTGIPAFIKSVEQSYSKSNQIRYFILHDTKCPKFTPNLPFYSEQVSLDLKINVYKDGQWGSYRRFKLADDVKPELQVDPSFTALSTLSTDEIDLHYLGFNGKDLSASPNNFSLELGHLDYSGANSKGERVMGLSPHQSGMTKLQPDPILKWNIPASWSFEEAATVPLAYTMAYYSLIEIARLTPKRKVLIHCGYTPIGMAALSIAVKEQCTIFTTYSNDEQAKLILKKFPSINRQHLFQENENFDIQINIITKGSGVDIVLNLSESKISASLECLGQYGRFLHLGQNKKELKSSIGMFVFLKAISVFGVNGNSLFEYPDSMKEKLRNLIQAGIEDGTVKPLDRVVTQGPCTDKDASEMIRASITNNSWKKIEHCIKPEKSKKSVNSLVNKFSCNRSRSYIVVGGASSLFLDIITWLVKRGAKKLVIINQQSMSTVSNRRLDLLMSEYSDLMVEKISADQIKSVKEAQNIICKAITLGPVDGAFFVALNEKTDLINYFDRATRNLCPNMSHFVCVLCGGGMLCDIRRECRLAGVALHCEKPKLHTAQVICALDKAISTNSVSQILLTECSSDSTSEDSKSFIRHLSWHLPSSTEELLSFGKQLTSTQARFEEICTLSPRYSKTKGTSPVFFIPGFKPNQFRKMISRLVYPAFIARLPAEISSVQEVAEELVKNLKSIRTSVCYTFIASGWGGLLALKMVSLLEREGILATVMMIDASPDSILKWTSSFKDDMEAKLINRYFSLTNEEQLKLGSLKDWNMVLSGLSDKVLKNVNDMDKMKLALTALRNRIQLFNDQSTPEPLKDAILLAYKPFETNISSSLSNLKNLCKNVITVSISEKTDLQSMVDDEDFIKEINTNVQFEYPDAIIKPETVKTLSSLVKVYSIRRGN
ncbi:fatty acid synthase isoform X4 [Nilaparvata lugens]|nr:fatty acid synthase isoform X2 [Nilaparvata lugens]XP_039289775.1 fatty acid synthase isoform X3 [Nilaparvata lugens]XP_039289776.1 fatty acid synthase isoform X4 [Nilaparvata lugens]